MSFGNINQRVDHHTRCKWFIRGPKHRKANQLLSLEHSSRLSLVSICKSDLKEVNGTLSNLFLERKVHEKKNRRQVDKCRKSGSSMNHFILFNYCQYTVNDNQYLERAIHHRPSLFPSVRQLNTNYIPHQLNMKIWIIYDIDLSFAMTSFY